MNKEITKNKTEIQKQNLETQIIRGSEVPEESKKNPFYNSYHWAMADWEEKRLYLPDNSDEAISFAVAAHELGHLVDEGRIQPDRFDFRATYAEEQRAWAGGWGYLEKYLLDYYDNNFEAVEQIRLVGKEIEKLLMEITRMTEFFYQKTDRDKNSQREEFLKTAEGQRVKLAINGLRKSVEQKVRELKLDIFLNRINWDKYIMVVSKAVMDIERDNMELEK